MGYSTSWIGNTFSGNRKWVQINIEAMYVAPDGTVYTNSIWDEAAKEAGIYKNGDVAGYAADLHGWERLGGKAVTANSRYLYVGMSQGAGSGKPGEDYPPKGTIWYCIRRYNLSGQQAPFSGGRGWDKSMVIVNTSSPVTGLAATDNEVYVSDRAGNRIVVYDANSMNQLRSFSFSRPGHIAIDQQKNLWIVQQKENSSAAAILRYSPQGQQLSEKITNVAEPTAIALDNQGRLLVADNGPRQQILIYNIGGSPSQVGTFGTERGVYSGTPGQIGDLKFYGITGVGTDAQGNIYVANNGFNNAGSDLRKFSPNGALQWRLLGLCFLDTADADPGSDGRDVFTKEEHYVMNYDKPNGQQWTYADYTVNAIKYPQDPRLNTTATAVFFRRVQGRPLMYLTGMYNSWMQIYRFAQNSEGWTAIPSGMFVGTPADPNKPFFTDGNWPPNQPKTGEWIWRDANSNGAFDPGEYDTNKDDVYIGGWWVDSRGDVWKNLRTANGIRHYPLQGFDGSGNPIYTYASMKKIATPSFFTDLRRVEYFPETDTMYLTGFTKENPPPYDDAKIVGSELVRFDNWSKGNRNPAWRTKLPVDRRPEEKQTIYPAAISVAGDYVFVATVKTRQVYVYRTSNGSQADIMTPDPNVEPEAGWVDVPYGVRAYRRSNGEYIVFLEEDHHGKVLFFRWQP
ncbi:MULTISPECIES: NHL repeat-containing protein [Nostocales]|uniref:NHL repeat-containing protein n=3 Tax=Nostocales TaxID=1161 RepID=A0A8S9T9L8_9CYAN|nr:SMP-30/gluconolactonase/LRE family protein [Tolypothrix bouteillei]KAF3888143.1 hypothetical protein DA73_0400023595 [Tolypothrix bouteillei VB521301]